jgi:hypothetical protein
LDALFAFWVEFIKIFEQDLCNEEKVERIVDEPGSTTFICDLAAAFSGQFGRNVVIFEELAKLSVLFDELLTLVAVFLYGLKLIFTRNCIQFILGERIVRNEGFYALFVLEPQLNCEAARKVPERLDQIIAFRNISFILLDDSSSLLLELLFDHNLVDTGNIELDLTGDVTAMVEFRELSLDAWQGADDLVHHESCVDDIQ